MENVWQTHRTSLIALGVALVALLSTVIVVPETQDEGALGRWCPGSAP